MKQQGHHNNMACLAYSPDGQYVATGSDDSKVRLARWRHRQRLQRSQCHKVMYNGLNLTAFFFKIRCPELPSLVNVMEYNCQYDYSVHTHMSNKYATVYI